MRLALAVAAVAALAATAEAAPWQCTLWPHSCPAEATPAPPKPAPLPAPAAPATPVAIPVPTPKPPVAHKRVKSNFAKQHKQAKRKAVALPSWCSRIPAGTSMDRVEGAASIFIGRPLSVTERQQARACLASKP